jgi:hypothetical protein
MNLPNKREDTMKRNIAQRTLVILSMATLYVSMAAPARAEGPQCTLPLTAGKYGVADSGTVVGIGPRAAIALVTLDAAGNINGKVTASLNGSVTHTTLSGTYTVNPDCTGTTSFGEFDLFGNLILRLTLDLVWDDNVQEFRFIFTSVALPDGTPIATAINGSARKLDSQSSNQQ